MSRSSRHKDRRGNHGELCQGNINDGTSARTRPFSFEEIMLGRKSKSTAVEVRSGNADGDDKEDTVEKAADGLQSDSRHGKPTSDSSRHVLEDSLKVISREREDNTSMISERKLTKDRSNGSRDNTESKSKLAPLKSLINDNGRGGKSDKHVNHKRRNDRSKEDSKYESGERYSRDPVNTDMSTGKSMRKSEKEREFKESNDNDRQLNKRRNVDRSRHDYENELRKRHLRNFTGSEKNGEGHGAQYEKERKKKHHEGEREKIEDRDGVKKLDLRASKFSEFSERREKESSRLHDEESRPKRRRSRSRERNDRGRRSASLSPKAHKHTFSELEHGGFSSHASKDKCQRSHSDVERKRTLSNSSNSYRRHSGSSSGLGGYSPRKRKTETAPKTSPSNHSPGRRTAGWDLPPAGDTVISGMMQSSSQIMSSSAQEVSIAPENSSLLKPVIMPKYTSEPHAIDSIQLTQATRPMRRLYVENLPASSSEKALMECINSFLLSSGVNHIHGTLPCISCMIHKEKGQALLEFLTPEDASAALSFDGRSFAGSILKIRRPKDFIELTTGGPNKSVDTNDKISSTVEDSIHKIFISGISRLISSQMLIDIARAFGPLKAFHFKHNADIDASCAFLEYIDHLITPKACAGLNGMKLGGQVLTVVQALPDASSFGNSNDQPFYGIPENAKPLLEEPSEILKIKNVLDSEGLSLLSEAEVEEILEDIRLECSRFGTVTAVNIVKQCNNTSSTESIASGHISGVVVDQRGTEQLTEKTTADELENSDESKPPNIMMEAVEVDGDSAGKLDISNPLSNSTEPDSFNKATVSNGDSDDKLLATDKTRESNINDRDTSIEDTGTLENSRSSPGEHATSPSSPIEQVVVSNEKIVHIGASAARDNNSDDNVERYANAFTPNADIQEKVKIIEEAVAVSGNVFEKGCVLVEFKRAEASCMAAHCLHGRNYDDRVVTVEYVSPYIYRKRFPK